MKYQWEGWFSVDVPSAWEVRETDGVIEIVPDDFEGAFDFSFLRRTQPSPPDADTARNVVERFASNNALVNAAPYYIDEMPECVRARAKFESTKLGESDPKLWIVCCILWRDAAVQASCCYEQPAERLDKVANEVFDSVTRA